MTHALVLFAALAASFTNDLAVLDVDTGGRVTSLRERATGRALVTNAVAAVYCRDLRKKRVFPVAARRSGPDSLVFSFPQALGELTLKLASFGPGWTISVTESTVDASRVSSVVPFRLQPCCARYDGSVLNMRSDDASGVIVRAYEESLGMRLDGEGVRVETDGGPGGAGETFGLVAGPRSSLVPALQAMTREAKAPVSAAGGAWSLASELNRESTLFATVSEASVDRWIDFAKRGGFGILHFSHWWMRDGSYPISLSLFPHGLDGMKACAEKAHAAGLKTGTHTMTGCLSVKDPWVGECPGELAARCRYELAEPLSADATDQLTIVGPLQARHDTFVGYTSNGNALRIGDEIVQYAEFASSSPHRFLRLTRGAFGTKPSAHPAGAVVDYLQQRYHAFVPQFGTPLAARIAARIADVFRACGHSDIYFDGAEALGSRQNLDVVRRQIFEALQASPVVESSNGGAHGWWYRSRLGTWDHPRWAAKRFHDLHIRQLVEMRKANLLAVQSGWWKPHFANDDIRGHFLDEMEYFAGKNAAYDFATTIHSVPLDKGPLARGVERQTELFGLYERFRRARAFTDEALAKLAVLGDEYWLRKNALGDYVFRKSDATVHRVTGRTDGTAAWTVTCAEPPTDLALRVEALYSPVMPTNGVKPLLTADDAAVVAGGKGVAARVTTADDDLAHGSAIVMSATNRGAVARGAWARAAFAFKPYRTMGEARAFRLWVRGDGKGELLNVQLASPREYEPGLSEHYLRIDFVGWRRVTFLLRERDAETVERYGWPYSPHYLVYRNRIDRHHVSGVSLYLNDIPAGGGCEVAVAAIEPLQIAKTVRHGMKLGVNGVTFDVPFALESGEYAEWEGGVWRHYSETGAERARQTGRARPALASGQNSLSFAAESSDGGDPRAEVTVFALGKTFPALKEGMGKDE